MFGNAPRTSEISVADAVHRSVVTRNYLKKYFGQLQRVAGAGARTEAYEERSRSGYGRLRLSSVSPPFCLGASNTAAHSPLSNWPRKKRGLLFAISDALRTRTH